MENDQRYFFICYIEMEGGFLVRNRVIDIHPLDWQFRTKENNKLVTWQEVSEQDYMRFKDNIANIKKAKIERRSRYTKGAE